MSGELITDVGGYKLNLCSACGFFFFFLLFGFVTLCHSVFVTLSLVIVLYR